MALRCIFLCVFFHAPYLTQPSHDKPSITSPCIWKSAVFFIKLLVWCAETLCKHAERLSLLPASCVRNSIFNVALRQKTLECKNRCDAVCASVHRLARWTERGQRSPALLPLLCGLIWSAAKSFCVFSVNTVAVGWIRCPEGWSLCYGVRGEWELEGGGERWRVSLLMLPDVL